MVISASLQACGGVFPFATLTSICRSIVTICSGLYLLIGMTSFSSKWILSHSTWYKFRRSRQLSRLCLNVLRQTDNFFRHVPRLDLRAAQLLCNSETLLSLSFWRRAWQGLPVRPRPKYCESAPIQTTFPTPTVLVKVSKTRLRWPWPRRSRG